MIGVFLYPFIFLLVYAAALHFNEKRTWKIPLSSSKILKNSHYISLPFLILVGVLNFGLGYDLKGIWTSRVIILFCLLSGILTYWLVDKAIFTKIENWYFTFLAKIPIIGAAFLLIPMLGYLTLGAILYQFATPYEQIYYSDAQIRVQRSFTTKVNQQKIEVIKKEGFLQKSIHHQFIYTPKIHKIEVQKERDSTKFVVSFEKQLPKSGDSTFVFLLLPAF